TGEVLAQKGDKLDRKLLNKIIPYLEREEDKLGEDVKEPQEAVLDEPIRLQSIEVVDPTDPDGERTLKVIGNAGVEKNVSILQRRILWGRSAISSTGFMASVVQMIATIWVIGDSVRWANSCKISFASVFPVWSESCANGCRFKIHLA